MRQAHRRDERPRAGEDRGHPPAGPDERRRGAGARRRQRGCAPWSRSFRRSAAVHSPETGIIDSHAFMLALQGDLEDAGGVIAFNTTIERLTRAGRGWEVHFGGAEAGEMPLDAVVNSASLGAQALALATEGYPAGARAEARPGEGQLFRLPRQAGLFAPDLSGAGRGRSRHAPDPRSCRTHALRPGRRVDRGGGLRGRPEPGGRCSTPRSGAGGRGCPTARWCRIIPASARSSRAGRAAGRFRHRRAGRARPARASSTSSASNRPG